MRATSVQVWDKDAGSEDDLMGVAEISKLERFPLWPIAALRSGTHPRSQAQPHARCSAHVHPRTNASAHESASACTSRARACTHSCSHSSIAAEKCHRRLQDGTFVRNPEIFLSGTRARAHTRVRVRFYVRACAGRVRECMARGRTRWSARR